LGIAKGVDTQTSGLPPQFAIIPMIIYLSSTISSWYLKAVYARIGRYLPDLFKHKCFRKKTFTVGAICALAGAIIMLVIYL
jgi:hypothetical protein